MLMVAIITIFPRDISADNGFAHLKYSSFVPNKRELPLILPGSIVVLPSGRMFYIKGIGVDRYGMGPYYSGEDVEHHKDGRLELLHVSLERFGYQEIIPPGPRVAELREFYGH